MYDGAMYTLNSAISFGFGKDFSDQKTADKEFRVRIHSPTRDVLDPVTELKKNALAVAKMGKPRLCLSGGLDSEIMASAFISAGIDFEAVIIRFENDLNLEDITHAISFCNENDIKFVFVDLNVIEFFSKRNYRPILNEYRVPSPEVAEQIYAYRQVPGNLVVGGEAFRVFKGSRNELDYKAVSELEAAIIKYFLVERSGGCPNFHFYSAEGAWSFFKTSLKHPSLLVENDHDPLFYDEKLKFYSACGFKVINRADRNIKLHGFEGVKKYFDEIGGEDGNYQKKFREPEKAKYPLSPTVKIIFDHKNPQIEKIFRRTGADE